MGVVAATAWLWQCPHPVVSPALTWTFLHFHLVLTLPLEPVWRPSPWQPQTLCQQPWVWRWWRKGEWWTRGVANPMLCASPLPGSRLWPSFTPSGRRTAHARGFGVISSNTPLMQLLFCVVVHTHFLWPVHVFGGVYVLSFTSTCFGGCLQTTVLTSFENLMLHQVMLPSAKTFLVFLCVLIFKFKMSLFKAFKLWSTWVQRSEFYSCEWMTRTMVMLQDFSDSLPFWNDRVVLGC